MIKYIGNSTNSLTNFYTGQVLGTFWGYKTVGKFQSQAQVNAAPSQAAIGNNGWGPGDIQYADLDHSGAINNGQNTVQDPGDRMILGNSTPQYQYGVTLGANYKGFDLTVFMQGVGKGQYFSGSNTFWGFSGDMYHSVTLKTLADRWTPSNPDGYFPRVKFGAQNQQAQSGYVLSLAYWRLKNLSLGYALAKDLINRVHLSKVRLYVSMDNLLTIAPELKHSYIDPELLTQGDGNAATPGQVYPLMRAVSVGVQISFQ